MNPLKFSYFLFVFLTLKGLIKESLFNRRLNIYNKVELKVEVGDSNPNSDLPGRGQANGKQAMRESLGK